MCQSCSVNLSVNSARLYSHMWQNMVWFFLFCFLEKKKCFVFFCPLGLKVSRLGAFCVMRLAEGLTCAIGTDMLTSSLKGGRE